MLRLYDVHTYYGESYIVQGVSFNVHEGEILALLGRNGAGKTSTLRALARLDNPQITHGEIWLDHKHVHTMSSYQAALADGAAPKAQVEMRRRLPKYLKLVRLSDMMAPAESPPPNDAA